MKHCSLRLVRVSLLVLGTLGVGPAASAQIHDHAGEDAVEQPDVLAERVTLEGFVLEADGAPAAGACVVTSAGGHAIADEHGRYRLEIDVASGTACVQVGATGAAGAQCTARATVALPGRSGPVPVGPLVLLESGTCEPTWVPTFGAQAGTNARIRALATYDDGSGPVLYAGGEFGSAGGVEARGIAKWDGSSWTSLGPGAELGGPVFQLAVHALAVHDDGSGPALFVGGQFVTAGGLVVNNVAKWDGSSWSALAGGTSGQFPANPSVYALAVFDDGSGPALYAGGAFTAAGGATALRVARWDGAGWTALGPGLRGGLLPTSVHALAVHDDGGGPALYVAGNFGLAGDLSVSNIARWDGSSWTALGGGTSNGVSALAAHDDGSGPALYAGGFFGLAGGVPVGKIAKWNGSSWASVGGGMDDAVRSLRVHDDGSGAALYAGGDFSTAGGGSANGIARWDGASWQALGSGLQMSTAFKSVYALGTFDDSIVPALFAGGTFTSAGGTPVSCIASWDGSSWSALGGGPQWVNGPVRALAAHDDGSGPALYAGGTFTSAGSPAVSRLARWDGVGWTSLGLGEESSVYAFAVYDDGGGPALYAGGYLEIAGDVERVAKWDGSSWTALGTGIDGWVYAFAVHDDGSGPALFVGGDFTSAGGTAANDVARWDGSSWTALGVGVGGISTVAVEALAVYDDGGGPALFVAGSFTTAGGAAANRIAKWDGSSWSNLGNGLNNAAYALVVHQGSLYAGGVFTNAGGGVANGVARWNGSTWTGLGGGIGGIPAIVYALTTHDDGSGPALYAGGTFSSAGVLAVSNLAKWDGSSWSALGRGANGIVYDLASRTDDGWPALYAAGIFGSAPDSGDASIAKWGCLDLPPALECPVTVFEFDELGGAGEIVTFTVSATDDHDPAPTVVCVPPSGTFFPQGTTIVTCTATDAHGHESTCTFPVIVQPKAQRRSL